MSLIKAIADLSINYNKKSLAEFQALPEYKELEQRSVVVEQLERYRFPPITLLICSSGKLRSLPWAQRYADFSCYCLKPEEIDLRGELEQGLKLEDFTDRFLALKYEPVIKRLSQSFAETGHQRKAFMEQRKRINAELKKASELEKRRIAANTGEDGEDVENEKLLRLKAERERLTNVITDYGKFIKKYKAYAECVEQYLALCNETEIKKVRDEIYESLPEIEALATNAYQQESLQLQETAVLEGQESVATEEEDLAAVQCQNEVLLQEFVDKGIVNTLLSDRLQAADAAQWLIAELGKAEYCSKALTILVRLHGLGEINLEQEEYTDFLVQNKDALEECLCQQYKKPDDLQESAMAYLYELVVRVEYKGAGGRFRRLWNCLGSRKAWLWLLSTLRNIEPDGYSRHIYKYMLGLSGETAKLVAGLLLADEQFLTIVKPLRIISELLVNSPADNRQLIYYYLLGQEQREKKLEKRVKELKQQVDRQTQELFAGIYQPVERLEELAVNVQLSDEGISHKLIAAKLMEGLVLLRKNLLDVGIEPLVEPSDWQQQKLLPYDEQKHQFAVPQGKRPEKVKARTMGFSYYNSDKQLQNREAFVYCNTLGSKKSAKSTVNFLDGSVEARGMTAKKNAGKSDTACRGTVKHNSGKPTGGSGKQTQQKAATGKIMGRKGSK